MATSKGPARHITPEMVITAVLRATGVDRNDLTGDTRAPAVVRARWMYSALCVRYTAASYPEIGAAIGKPHSSVFTHVRGHDRLINDADYGAIVAACHRLLGEPRPVERLPASRPEWRGGRERCRSCGAEADGRDGEGDPACYRCIRADAGAAVQVWHEVELTGIERGKP